MQDQAAQQMDDILTLIPDERLARWLLYCPALVNYCLRCSSLLGVFNSSTFLALLQIQLGYKLHLIPNHV
jgi:hypothetical protein